mgnify:CR=1 FL=1
METRRRRSSKIRWAIFSAGRSWEKPPRISRNVSVKYLQQRQSLSINRQDTSTSINTQMDSLIPASKIANLSQGAFVGSVADNFGEEIEQKIFHARNYRGYRESGGRNQGLQKDTRHQRVLKDSEGKRHHAATDRTETTRVSRRTWCRLSRMRWSV